MTHDNRSTLTQIADRIMYLTTQSLTQLKSQLLDTGGPAKVLELLLQCTHLRRTTTVLPNIRTTYPIG